MVKVAVVGSRTLGGYQDEVFQILDAVQYILVQPITVVSGGAKGVDELAEKWALSRHRESIVFKADWQNISHPDARIKTRADGVKYDALAGFRRNQLIIDEADICIAIWDGSSRGTLDSIERARKASKPMIVFQSGIPGRQANMKEFFDALTSRPVE